jgi:hypothetical protein
MPDIISRIKLEAQGADAAAREVRKLQQAYEDVSKAASGIPGVGGSAGGQDPFTKATSGPGGLPEGVQGISYYEKLRANETYNKAVNDRKNENERYNSGIRAGTVTQGFGTAEAISQGRGGQAVGGLAGMVGSLVSGPAGIATAIIAAGAMGVQHMADKAYDRLEQTFGTGMSQRLGLTSLQTQNEMIGFARMGVPQSMVQSFFNAASGAGVDFTRASTQGAANASMIAANALGVDPSVLAALVGTLNRANVNASNVASIGTFSMARNAFGQADVGTYLQSLNAMIESANTRGIESYTGTTMRAASEMAGLKTYGGFSTTGAASFAQQLQTRGASAANLQSPEDIIAFQAMRNSGMSVTDALIAMEENPFETNQRVYEYLQRTSGGDEDLLRLRMQKYLGAGTSMSAVDKYIRQQQQIQTMETKGMSQTEIMQSLGYNENLTQSWTGITMDEKGNLVSSMDETKIFQVRQNEMFKDFQDSMLQSTSGITKALIEAFGHIPGFNPMSMSTKGYAVGDLISQEVGVVDSLTVQDVSNLEVVLNRETESRKQVEDVMSYLGSPIVAAGFSTSEVLRTNPELFSQVNDLFQKSGGNANWNLFVKNIAEGEGTLSTGTVGDWGTLFGDIQSNLLTSIRSDVGNATAFGRVRENKDVIDSLTTAMAEVFSGPIVGQTLETFQQNINLLLKIIAEQGIVYTDGDWKYQGE